MNRQAAPYFLECACFVGIDQWEGYESAIWPKVRFGSEADTTKVLGIATVGATFGFDIARGRTPWTHLAGAFAARLPER